MTRSDADLLRAHLAGEHGAFVELIDRYQRLLWTVALRQTGNPADADDAVQDALLRAHQAASTCRATDSVRPWLVTIVSNACRDRYRRGRARPADPTPAEEFELVPAPRDPISEWLDRDELADALAELPLEQRQVVELVELYGLPVAEVAALLGVAEGTVKSRNWRARLRLRRLLDPERRVDSTTASTVDRTTARAVDRTSARTAARTEQQWTS